jgi:F-type H+-transporting ATPase subunit gamma
MPPDMTMFGIVQDPTMKSARRIMREIMNLFDTELTDEIYVIYTSFFGKTKNQPVTLRLLPLELADTPETPASNYSDALEHFPDARTVFDQIVPQYVLGLMFDVMVQAYAGEHFARMNAMRSSTENANDMLKSLEIQYNMARQSAITNEIAEITGANEVLKER